MAMNFKLEYLSFNSCVKLNIYIYHQLKFRLFMTKIHYHK
jgi:hypothetical protein